LSLEDKLTAGLNRFKQQFENLRDVGKSLSLGKLQNAGDVLRNLGREARELTGNLRGIVGVADRAYAAIKRVGSATFGKEGLGGKVGAIGSAVAGVSVAAPIMQYASFEDQLRHIAITKGLSGAAADDEIKRLNRLIDREALAGSQSSQSVTEAYYGLQTGGAGTSSQVEEALAAHTRAATAYKIDPEAFTPVTLALMKNFKIFGDDLARSLAAVGQASKEGQLKVTDYASVLPQVAGPMNTYGLTGFENANLAIAAMQNIRTDVGEAGQAGTDYAEMLRSMYSNQGQKGFALEGKGSTGHGPGSEIGARARALMEKATGSRGIDIYKLIDNGAKQGIGPVDVVLNKLTQIKSKLTTHEFSDLLNQMFSNQEALKGWQALLNHAEQFKALRAELNGINAAKVTTDYGTASSGPEAAVRRAEEGGTQVTRRVGEGFSSLLTPANAVLRGILATIDMLDDKLPGVGNGILMVAGAFLSLGAATGALGVAAPMFKAGWQLMKPMFSALLSPVKMLWTGLSFLAEGIAALLGVTVGAAAAIITAVVAIVAAIAGAAYDIIEHWERFRDFFAEMWAGIKDLFGGFTEFLFGVFTLDTSRIVGGLGRMWQGLGELLGGIWGTTKQLFLDFVSTLDGWTGGAVIKAFNAIRDSIGSVIDKIREWIELLKDGAIGRLLGLSAAPAPNPADSAHPAGAAAAAAAGAPGGSSFGDPSGGSSLMPPAKVDIGVSVDKDGRLVLTRATSDSPAVKVGGPDINPGPTLGRH
jgi:hypothetical protein